MFEKEAEEYLGNFADCANCKERWNVCADSLDEYCLVNDCCYASPKEQDIYIAGAEFGYNKANEWHYVKDGDLPKETGLLMSKTLLLITKMKGSDCLSLALGEYNFSTQEFSYQHIVGLTDVIAWKEIILPKEIKENE